MEISGPPNPMQNSNVVTTKEAMPCSFSIHKVKVFRALGLAGGRPYCRDGFAVPEAIGAIEVVGSKAEGVPTTLRIVFSNARSLPPPSFQSTLGEGVGTLALPAAAFGSYLALLQAPRAFFRTGGDGSRNALASEKSMLEAFQ